MFDIRLDVLFTCSLPEPTCTPWLPDTCPPGASSGGTCPALRRPCTSGMIPTRSQRQRPQHRPPNRLPPRRTHPRCDSMHTPQSAHHVLPGCSSPPCGSVRRRTGQRSRSSLSRPGQLRLKLLMRLGLATVAGRDRGSKPRSRFRSVHGFVRETRPTAVRRGRHRGVDADIRHLNAKVIAANRDQVRRQRCTSYGS